MHAMVRTFRAPDARTALAKVKSALGSNAVILSTREVPGGLFRSGEIEVTAGIDDDAMETPSARVAPTAPAPVGVDPGTPLEMAGEITALREAFVDMRRELRDGRSPTAPATGWKLSAAVSTVLQGLEQRGVDAALAEELVRQAVATPDCDDVASLFAAVRGLVSRRVFAGPAPWQRAGRNVLALVGPTGVGKTTTLAKIAARALMETELKVALITVDTYRIGASDQLARYGEIMRVPTFVAREKGELARVIQRTRDFDLVLIDTAGRSTSEAVAKQAELIRAVPGVELALVLSLATGARDLAASAARYQVLAPESVIFTKLDEAAAPGGLLSAMAGIERGITCVADGQRVPEDLHALSDEELQSLVTGNLPAAQAATGRMA